MVKKEMRIIKAKYPDGSPLHTTFLTSRKEVFVALWCYGMEGHAVKVVDKYCIQFCHKKGEPREPLVCTNLKTIDGCTAKWWIEFAQKHCPETSKCIPLDDKLRAWFRYPNVIKAVEKETL